MTPPDLSPVGRLAREGDEARFLAALCAPPAMRERLFALIAFNCELAKIPATVSEPMLGEIRLQWWRDAVEALYGGGRVAGHEVIQALEAERSAFDPAALIALIDARGFALGAEGAAAADMTALGGFIDATGGGYAEAAVRALGGNASAGAVARLAGRAEGAGRLLLAMPDLGADGRAEVDAARAALARDGLAALAEARARRAEIPRVARAPLFSVHAAVPTLRAAAAGTPADAASPFRARAEFLLRAATGRF